MSFLQDAYNEALEDLNKRIQKAIDELDNVLTDNVVEGSISPVPVPLALPAPDPEGKQQAPDPEGKQQNEYLNNVFSDAVDCLVKNNKEWSYEPEHNRMSITVVEGSVPPAHLQLPNPVQTAPVSTPAPEDYRECVECGFPDAGPNGFCSDECAIKHKQRPDQEW